ncbi:hypothetical protein [Coralliovum pocilloporae]|uniref:hypothetical protein n=1 Tax=Coralliovum pocilloporae TaxID=3066369 RepID=UPI003306C551
MTDTVIENPFETTLGDSSWVTEINKDDQGQLFKMRRKRASLIMFSGGIDSTYALKRMLNDTDDDILVHHIHLINIEGRHKAEARSCAAIVDHLKATTRDFFYTECTIDRSRFRAFGMDVVTAAFEAGIVASSFFRERGYMADRWTTGACLDEIENSGVEDEKQRLEAMLMAVDINCRPNPSPKYFQLPYIRKKDQIAYLGPELTQMCWTCRTPIANEDGTFEACGECKTCKLMQRL